MADVQSVGAEQTRGFLFADLRGYTDFVERRGDEAAARLLARYRRMVREVVARHTGAEVRTEGDSFYVLFPSVSQAVRAALDIVAGARADAADNPDASIRVGVGIHAGEAAETDEGPVGSAVNVAARICAAAGPGEVLVSDTVRGLTRTRTGMAFQPVGRRRLKGIGESITLYRVVSLAEGADRPVVTSRLGRPTATSWTAISVGVLALGLISLIGFAVLNAFAGPRATATPSPSSAATGAAAATATGEAANAAPTVTDVIAQPTERATPTPAPTKTTAPVTGTRLIYSRQVPTMDLVAGCDATHDSKLHVLDPDEPGVAPYRLTQRTDLYERLPTWSRDGAVIAFVGDVQDGFPTLFTVPASGGPLSEMGAFEQRADLFASARLSISPDNSIVVFAAEGALYGAPANGGDVQRIMGRPLEDDPGSADFNNYIVDAAFLNDGDALALIIHSDGKPAELRRTIMDGTAQANVAFDFGGLRPASIDVAPDGDTIAIGAGGSIHIGTLSSQGRDLRQIAATVTEPTRPAFSPDGSQVAMHGGGYGYEQIYVADVESGNAHQVTDEAGVLACTPTWSVATAGLALPPPPEDGEPRAFERGYLVPGKYSLDLLQPNMEMTFPDGWHARRNYVDGWSVQLVGDAEQVNAGRIQVGLNGPCLDDEQSVLGRRPSDLVSWIQARADLLVENERAINLGGHTGIVLDVAPRQGAGCEDGPGSTYWALFQVGETVDSLGDAGANGAQPDRLRLIALDVRGSTVSFLVYAAEGDLDRYWEEQALPLLETLSFPAQ